ncbi:MAG TPA: sulfur carrier protein ThiS [Acidimicrobiia bacterium]|nr:sulfur carrier protein ThiS [Acidimicrobiia bacterium]
MRITVNGEDRTVPPGTTVGSVVDSLRSERRGLAAALNEEVVPRSRWDDVTVSEGDRIEVLTAAQGG